MSARKRKLPSDTPFSEASIASAALPIAVSLIEKRRDCWNLSNENVNSALALMKVDKLTEEQMKDELRVFLYAKGIMEDKSKRNRKEEFDNLLYPDKADVSEEARLKLRLARERLERIVSKGEEGSFIDPKSNMFTDFVAEHPEWGPKTNFVVFRDHALLKDKPHVYVQRFQLSGLCFMHAPIALQHYLVAMHSTDRVPMLDMGFYLKRHMSAESLEDRIWRGRGGDSEAFLRQILLKQPAPNLLTRRGSDEMESYLKSFGPALISRFSVEEAFDSEEWQHLGPATTATTGKHAMVLVGVRKECGSTRYLVQNWWEKKAFVEMDGAYLEAREALINFVQTPQTAMGSYLTNAHNHVKCEMLDAQETFNSEGSF